MLARSDLKVQELGKHGRAKGEEYNQGGCFCDVTCGSKAHAGKRTENPQGPGAVCALHHLLQHYYTS